MKLKTRIQEARDLLRDIETDLAQVAALEGARNPETSARYLEHISCVTLHELREHINELLAHYEWQAQKRRKALRKAAL